MHPIKCISALKQLMLEFCETMTNSFTAYVISGCNLKVIFLYIDLGPMSYYFHVMQFSFKDIFAL